MEEKTPILHIKTLGTGAADYDWSRFGEPGIRGSTSTLLNGSILIDAGRSAWGNLERFQVSPDALTDILITHTHSDHFDIANIRRILEARAAGAAPVTFWVSPEGAGILESELKDIPFKANPLTWGVSFQVGDFTVTPIPSNHQIDERPREETFWFFIETPAGNLLYALDGAWMSAKGFRRIARKRLDWIIWDGTMENAGDWRTFEHSDLTMLEMQITALREWKMVDDKTLNIVSHVARTLWPADEETARKHAAARGFLMAYDGMELELNAR